MAIRLRQHLSYYRLHEHLERLSALVRWSVLAKIGSAPAMRLTALVPLIGTVLLFNQQIEQLLAWPTFFRQDFPASAGEHIPHHNLYFTYFGC